MGADADRTSRSVPDVLNATCVVPDPPREVVMLPGAVRAARAGFAGFVRTWEAVVGRVYGGCIRSSADTKLDVDSKQRR